MQPEAPADIEALWKAFGDYVCKPYANIPEHLAAARNWFTELYARREKDGIQLSVHLIENQLSGRRFNAFCLNKQIYFSDDVAVLTLHRPFNKAYATSRLAGVYLNNTLTTNENWRSLYKQGIQKISQYTPFTKVDYDEFIFGELKKRLSSPDLPQETANHFPVETKLKIARTHPYAYNPHRDYDFMIDFDYAEPCWSTALHYALIGPGTTYRIGNQEDIKVTAPPRSMCAHLEMYVAKEDIDRARGIYHYATGHADGRMVAAPRYRLTTLLKDCQPTPWRISHQMALG